jgi:3-oxoacyl-[acyl-carrier protein] reductase
VAQQLADAGCHVALVDLNAKRCEELAAQLPTRSIGVAFDVSSEASVTAGVTQITEQLGGVDVLVNVAGILSNNKCFETSAEEWRKVHAVNYDSCFYLSKACMPHMVAQGWGRVVNLSSWAWKSGGLTAGTAYSASKAAVVGLTFSLARQFAADGVTVNGVAPCYVFSPMIMEQLTAEKRAELLQTIPVRRFCTPEEVAHAVLFLVSPLSGFITGEIVDMNGGFQMD